MKEQKFRQITCKVCKYTWQPRKEPSQVKECPECHARLGKQKS